MTTTYTTKITDLRPIDPGWMVRLAYIEEDGSAVYETHPVVGWAVTEIYEYERADAPLRPTGERGVSPAVWDEGHLLTFEECDGISNGAAEVVPPGCTPDDADLVTRARRRRAEREARA